MKIAIGFGNCTVVACRQNGSQFGLIDGLILVQVDRQVDLEIQLGHLYEHAIGIDAFDAYVQVGMPQICIQEANELCDKAKRKPPEMGVLDEHSECDQ